jgi:predicted metal-dependent phosphoesterase TrpH
MSFDGILRADLHLHSYHSGHAGHLRFLRARDCYSEPEAVYAAAKARGMDVVTITDHDSIDGCREFLDRRPEASDFFISEEIECKFPGADLKVHVGAYGIDEQIHREIQPLRRDVREVAGCLRAHDVFFVLNHPFFFYKGQVTVRHYLETLLPLFPGVEVRNGTMLPAHNQLAERIASEWMAANGVRIVTVGGSDSHTLHGIGTTYTQVAASSTRDFLQSLRAGHARPRGRHGSAFREAREIYGVIGRYWASLAGLGRQELTWRRRAVGLAFSAATLPGELSPLLIAASHKRDEARRVRACRSEWQQMSADWRPARGPGDLVISTPAIESSR